MTWFKVDDSLDFHPKVIAAGNAAMGLWVRAGAYCARQLTEGFLERSMVQTLGGKPKDAAALVAAGLWEPVDGGYQFHEWEERNPTKERVLADRAAAAERQRRARERAAEQRLTSRRESRRDSGATSRRDKGVSHGPPDPTRPVENETADAVSAPQRRSAPTQAATTDLVLVGAESRPTAQTLVGEWIDHCRTRPPGNVIGQVAKQIGGLLAEGIDPSAVRSGLAAWHAKGLHPSTLPSVVNEVLNPPATATNGTARTRERQRMFARWDEIADDLAAKGF